MPFARDEMTSALCVQLFDGGAVKEQSTPLTFCSTISTILHTGATPVLADIGDDGNIDPEAVAECVTSRTRAVIPVHLSGLPCQMDAIWDLARKKKLLVVEDATHAAGSHYHGLPIGGVDLSAGIGSERTESPNHAVAAGVVRPRRRRGGSRQ
jgi:dTDP-4-amino-4,6-dideoxygalactose transaminase